MRRPSLLAWVRLARVVQKLDRAGAEELRRRNLSLAQFDVLAQVGVAEGMTQQELADKLLVTKGNVCQMLDKMERSNLIVRRPEGRTNRLWLTPRGRELYEEVIPEHEDFIDRQLSALTREEQLQLHELLRKLDHALKG